MIELVQTSLILLFFYGHIAMLFERPLNIVEPHQGFAELYVDGRFVKYIDLR